MKLFKSINLWQRVRLASNLYSISDCTVGVLFFLTFYQMAKAGYSISSIFKNSSIFLKIVLLVDLVMLLIIFPISFLCKNNYCKACGTNISYKIRDIHYCTFCGADLFSESTNAKELNSTPSAKTKN